MWGLLKTIFIFFVIFRRNVVSRNVEFRRWQQIPAGHLGGLMKYVILYFNVRLILLKIRPLPNKLQDS